MGDTITQALKEQTALDHLGTHPYSVSTTSLYNIKGTGKIGYAIYTVTDTVLAAGSVIDMDGDSLVGVVIPANTTIKVKVSAIQLTSGHVIIYRK